MDLNSLIFNSLIKTNKALFVYDTNNEVLTNFLLTSPVGQLLCIGTKENLIEVPFTKFKHSVTYLADSLETAYLDQSLNSPVDLIYIDSSNVVLNNLNFLTACVDLNTTVVVKFINKTEVQNSDYFLKQFKFKCIDITENLGYLIYVP